MEEPYLVWDLNEDPDGNVQHIAEHDVSKEEVEEILFCDLHNTVESRSSDRYITFGYTSEGRYLAVVWEHAGDDPLTIYPVTAYDAPPPRGA